MVSVAVESFFDGNECRSGDFRYRSKYRVTLGEETMLNAYERQLILFYLCNAASRFHRAFPGKNEDTSRVGRREPRPPRAQ